MTPSSPARDACPVPSSGAQASPETPEQQELRRLREAVGQQGRRLADWQQALDNYRDRHARNYLPLVDRYHGLYAELLLLLEQARARPELSRSERADLDALIVARATPLATTAREVQIRQAMTALLQRCQNGTAERRRSRTPRAEADAPAEPASVDPLDPDAWDQLERRAQQARQRAEAGREQHRRQRKAARQAQTDDVSGTTDRAQALQAEAQSLRALYRKLASELHPDREPDPLLHARKTALMQRANRANAEQDVLALLALQQEAQALSRLTATDHTRPGAPITMPSSATQAEPLLRAQWRQQQATLTRLQQTFLEEFGVAVTPTHKPARLQASLNAEVRELTTDVQQLQQLLRLLEDSTALRAWLRAQEIA